MEAVFARLTQALTEGQHTLALALGLLLVTHLTRRLGLDRVVPARWRLAIPASLSGLVLIISVIVGDASLLTIAMEVLQAFAGAVALHEAGEAITGHRQKANAGVGVASSAILLLLSLALVPAAYASERACIARIIAERDAQAVGERLSLAAAANTSFRLRATTKRSSQNKSCSESAWPMRATMTAGRGPKRRAS